MPVMCGFKLAEILRKEKKCDIPILAMTANNSETEKRFCLELGMNNYL